jgi:hypothetical protein
MSDFDDFNNDFLSSDEPEENYNDGINDEAQKIIDMINNFSNNPENLDLDKIDEELDNTLGEPDSIEYEKNEEFYIERRIWYKESGMIIKTLMSDTPFDEIILQPEITLTEQLNKAVADEEYELAALIRDKIKKDIAKEKRQAKKLLKEYTENQVIIKKDENN